MMSNTKSGLMDFSYQTSQVTGIWIFICFRLCTDTHLGTWITCKHSAQASTFSPERVFSQAVKEQTLGCSSPSQCLSRKCPPFSLRLHLSVLTWPLTEWVTGCYGEFIGDVEKRETTACRVPLRLSRPVTQYKNNITAKQVKGADS